MPKIRDIDEVRAKSGLDPKRITVDQVKNHSEARLLIDLADAPAQLAGELDDGWSHVTRVSEHAGQLLRELRFGEREAELTVIAGLLHDVGKAIHKSDHGKTGAIMVLPLLSRIGMPMGEAVIVAAAIANHSHRDGKPVSNISAALIIADKLDILRSRVRNAHKLAFQPCDEVNFAVEKYAIGLNRDLRVINYQVTVDTSICRVMEFMEMLLPRMTMSRKGASFLNCELRLSINDIPLM